MMYELAVSYIVGNFYHNFPKHVTGVLFNYSFVKLRWNSRKFSYFLVKLRKHFLTFSYKILNILIHVFGNSELVTGIISRFG